MPSSTLSLDSMQVDPKDVLKSNSIYLSKFEKEVKGLNLSAFSAINIAIHRLAKIA